MAVALLLPVLRSGYILRYDMLFVPRRPLSLSLLGISERLPRQVPIDALVALGSWAVPADWLEKFLLAGIIVLGAVGAGRLVPSRRLGPSVVAGLFYVWNPFVYERLSIGHWSLLLSYAALPWVAIAALTVRDHEDTDGITRWARLGLWLGAASVANPYGGIIAMVLAFAVIAGPPWRRGWAVSARSMVAVIGLAVIVSLPWLAPAFLRSEPFPNSLQGLRAFAPRSDSPLGTVGSVLSLGGMWNTSLAPSIRHGWGWVPGFALVLFGSVVGWRWLRRARPAMAGVLVAGVLGAVMGLGARLPLLGGVYRWIALNAPGGALLRDSQKFMGLLSLAYAEGLGSALLAWTGTPSPLEVQGEPVGGPGPSKSGPGWMRSLLPFAFTLLVVSLLPTMAWGLGGRLSTVAYPSDWRAARATTMEDPSPGAILSLPWHPHLPISWNRGTTTLNPASAFFARRTVTSDRLELRSGTLPAESEHGRQADGLVRSDLPLSVVMRRTGARYLVLLKEADWRRYRGRVTGLERVLDGRTVALYRLRGTVDRVPSTAPSSSGVIAADVLALAGFMLMGAALRGRQCENGVPSRGPMAGAPDILHAHEGGGP